jgi:hypothetical protein
MSQELILIMGMHRSGTSCLTGCLQQMGLNLGDVSEHNKYNLKGNRENKNIFRLNEAVLNHNKGAWNKPPVELNWTAAHEEARQHQLVGLQQLPEPAGFKDPRMLLVWPFWKPVLSTARFIGTFRNPTAVANSLYAREKLRVELEDGIELWFQYNRRLFDLQQEHGFALINFDLEKDAYLGALDAAAAGLNLPHGIRQVDFFENKLRNQHQKPDLLPVHWPEKVVDLYESLQHIAKN